MPAGSQEVIQATHTDSRDPNAGIVACIPHGTHISRNLEYGTQLGLKAKCSDLPRGLHNGLLTTLQMPASDLYLRVSKRHSTCSAKLLPVTIPYF